MTNLQKYAELKNKAKDIAQELKELEPIVFDEVMAVDGEKLETGYGTFSMTSRNVWKYSEKLTEKEKNAKEAIKLMKKEEELKKIATLDKVKSSLRFQAKKQ